MPIRKTSVAAWVAAIWVTAIVVASPAVLAAQETATSASTETTIPGGTLAVISYAVLWVGLLAFVGYLGWRQSRLYDELDALEGRLDAVLGEEFDDDA